MLNTLNSLKVKNFCAELINSSNSVLAIREIFKNKKSEENNQDEKYKNMESRN